MVLNYVQIGKRVGELRKRRGLSQLALAEMVDRSPTYISYIENGLKCMSLPTLVSIANALQVTADELLQDSLENTIVVSNHEFASLLADCNEYERRVLFETATAAKKAVRENRHFLTKSRR